MSVTMAGRMTCRSRRRSTYCWPVTTRGCAPGCLAARLDAEDRVARGDLAQLGVGGLRVHAVKEHADLPAPALEVSAQQPGLVVVGQLGEPDRLGAATDAQFGLPVRGADVADPLGDAARGNEVAVALEVKQVDGGGAQFPGRPAAHVQYPRAVDADAQPGQPGDGVVERCGGLARLAVAGLGGHL